MKFEKMRLPVLTGMASIEKYSPKGEIYLSSVRLGIPCIIMNGKVCDSDGLPFKNDEFQSDFKEFAERAMNCKTIVTGHVIDITAPYRDMDKHDFSELQRITYNSKVFARNRDNIRIETEDLFSVAAQGLEYKQRHMFLSNMIMSIATTTKKKNVEMQSFISMSEFNKDDANKFILEAASRNEYVLARDSSAIYKQGDARLNEVKSFLLNQYEEFDEMIKTISFIEEKHIEIDKKEQHLKSITVLKDGNLLKIDYTKSKPATRRLLYQLIMSKKMKSIKFESVFFDGEYKYSRSL
jgi:hypothetical protein